MHSINMIFSSRCFITQIHRGYSISCIHKRFLTDHLNPQEKKLYRQKAEEWYWNNRDRIVVEYGRKPVLVEEGRVIKSFDTLYEAEAWMGKNARDAFLTVVGDEKFRTRLLHIPLLTSSEVPPSLNEPAVFSSSLDKLNLPRWQFFGIYRTPWILLPLRKSPQSEVIYPTWFLPDTGSPNSFLAEDTRNFLDLPDAGSFYLFNLPDSVFYSPGESVKVCTNINLAGRNILYRGTFLLKSKTVSFDEFGPELL